MGPVAVFAIILLLLVLLAAGATTVPFFVRWCTAKLKRSLQTEGIKRSPTDAHLHDEEAEPDVLTAVWSNSSEFRIWVIDGARFYWTKPEVLVFEVCAGFATSILKVPQAMALSYVVGVHPMQGLHGTFIGGLMTAVFGGRPGTVSGTCAAMAVILRRLMEDDGPFGDECTEQRREYVFFTVLLAGLLQTLCSFCKLTKLVRLIPHTAKMGFFNGLGLAIFISQFVAFRRPPGGATRTRTGCEFVEYGLQHVGDWYTLEDNTTWLIMIHMGFVVAIALAAKMGPKMPMLSSLHPKLPDCSIDKVVPPTLLAMLFGLLLEWGIFRQLDVETPLVKDIARLEPEFIQWHMPDVDWDSRRTWENCLPTAAFLAVAGMVETQLTVNYVDELQYKKTSMSFKNQETCAQGISNMACGLFMGLGSDASHAPTMAHLYFGSRYRVGAVSAAFFVIIIPLLFPGFLEAIPTGVLIGIMMALAIHEFDWPSIALLVRQSLHLHAVASIIGVTIIGAVFNLGIAIVVGIIWECVCFVFMQAQTVQVVPIITASAGDQKPLQLTYRVMGRLFFANTDEIKDYFKPETDPPKVIVDLANSDIVDYSAMHTLNQLGRAYQRVNKELHIHMKLEDYEHYIHVADEGFVEGKSSAQLRKVMPTYATQFIEGRVLQRDLQPDRFQCFEDALEGLPGPYKTKNGKYAFVEDDCSKVSWPNEESTPILIYGNKIEMKLPSGKIHVGVFVDGSIKWSDEDVWIRQKTNNKFGPLKIKDKGKEKEKLKEPDKQPDIASNYSAHSAEAVMTDRGGPNTLNFKDQGEQNPPGVVPQSQLGPASSSEGATNVGDRGQTTGAASSSEDEKALRASVAASTDAPVPPPLEARGSQVIITADGKRMSTQSAEPERPASPPPTLPEAQLSRAEEAVSSAKSRMDDIRKTIAAADQAATQPAEENQASAQEADEGEEQDEDDNISEESV